MIILENFYTVQLALPMGNLITYSSTSDRHLMLEWVLYNYREVWIQIFIVIFYLFIVTNIVHIKVEQCSSYGQTKAHALIE